MLAVPSGPPPNVSAVSTGTKSIGILVKWDKVKSDERNGIILGYKVIYWTGSEGKNTVDVPDSNAYEIEISGLQFLTEYKVELLAYTKVGNGPTSAMITVITDESSTKL